MKQMIIIFLYILFLCNCTKTIDVKTNIVDKINFIEPKKCKMNDFGIMHYDTKINKDKLYFDNNNLYIFLKNFYIYDYHYKKYIQCLENSNIQYQEILKELKR